MSLLDFALGYARMGWHVFPCHSVTVSGCSCGDKTCRNVGKHPRTANGAKDASTDQSQVRAWWERWPEANIAGRCDKMTVTDVDTRDGKPGRYHLDAAIAAHNPLPETFTVRTGSGGTHYFFAGETRTSSHVLGKGSAVDTRSGTTGYVILPPSRNDQGAYSVLTVAPLAPLPEWLRARIMGDHVPNADNPWAGLNEVQLANDLDTKLRNLVDLPRGAGRRNAVLKLAMHLAADLRRTGLSAALALQVCRSTILPALEERAAKLGPDYDRKDSDNAKILETSVRKVYSEDQEARPGAPVVTPPSGDRGERIAVGQWSSYGARPEREWVCTGMQLGAGRPNFLLAHGGSGKTIIAQDAGIAVASGGMWLGHPCRRGGVVHVDFELGLDVVYRRYARMAHARGVELDTLALELVSSDPHLWLNAKDALTEWSALMSGRLLVIIDSLSMALPGVDENSALIQEFIGRLTPLSNSTGCAVIIIHHSKKPSADGPTDRRLVGRGSGAILAQTGAGWVLESKDDGTERVLHQYKVAAGAGRYLAPIALDIIDTDGGSGLQVTVTAKAEDTKPESVKEAPLEDRLLDLIRSQPGVSVATARDTLGVQNTRIGSCRDILVTKGLIRTTAKRYGGGMVPMGVWIPREQQALEAALQRLEAGAWLAELAELVAVMHITGAETQDLLRSAFGPYAQWALDGRKVTCQLLIQDPACAEAVRKIRGSGARYLTAGHT